MCTGFSRTPRNEARSSPVLAAKGPASPMTRLLEAALDAVAAHLEAHIDLDRLLTFAR